MKEKPDIIFLPVDERFCTRDYFLHLAESCGINVQTPPLSFLGQKKIPPDMKRLFAWLNGIVQPGNLLIISLDMLIHGGLIPSRMSLESLETLRSRFDILKKFKERGVKIYASICVTRTPFYNSAEEEPDYWQYFGEKIYNLSRFLARKQRGENLDKFIKGLSAEIPSWIIEDYTFRRNRNFELISEVIDLVKVGTIDFLNLVLDDNSAESLSLVEAEKHSKKIESYGITQNVSVHAGADESLLTLLSKLLVDLYGVSPEFKIEYSSPGSSDFIPPYEGSPLREGVKNHIKAAGGKIVDTNEDILLLVNNPYEAIDSPLQPAIPDGTNSYMRFINTIEMKKEKIIGIADVKYTNGADNYLVKRLFEKQDIDWNKFNFSAWNTAGNTLGTACAFSIIQYLGKAGYIELDVKNMIRLQAIFFLEHWGFQSNVRQKLISAAKEKGVNPWTVIPVEDWAIDFTRKELEPYKHIVEKKVNEQWEKFEIFFPWHRSFEIGIVLE